MSKQVTVEAGDADTSKLNDSVEDKNGWGDRLGANSLLRQKAKWFFALVAVAECRFRPATQPHPVRPED